MVEDHENEVPSGEQSPPAAETDLRELIKEAFAVAHAAGKPDEMTVAVLKNRLLDRTGHEFSESNYGYSSMSDMARRLPDLLELNETARPARVKLRENISSSQLPDYSGFQVRTDLWNATLDYSRGEPYIWHVDAARPASEVGEGADGPALPTVTLEEETAWRREFQERASASLSQDLRDIIKYWIDNHQTPKILPGFLQRQWNIELKNHVIERLRAWFADNSIPEPSDFLLPYRRPLVKAPDRVAQLRALVIRCVQNMTEDELTELRLPPQVLLRGEK
jgi:hypothetical protein